MSLVGTLRVINRRLGFPARRFVRLREVLGQRLRWRKFESDRQRRAADYAGRRLPFRERADIAARLERDGYVILRDFVRPDLLKALAAELDGHLDRGSCLSPVSDDAARAPGDRSAAQVFLGQGDLVLGQGHFRTRTNYAAVADPLLNTRAAAELAFDRDLLDIAQSYLGAPPALGGLNLRKSFRNELPEFDTLYFHVDPDSPKFLKAFFYLNDVDLQGGPFCYVRGSHRRRFPGWMAKYRWSEDEIAERYGKDAVLYLTANVGDVVIADTNGFHRGTKITGSDRRMLTLDYLIHRAHDGAVGMTFKLPRTTLDRLDERQRSAADFLQIV